MIPIPRLESFEHYVRGFNAAAEDDEDAASLVPDAQAWEWMKQNVPLFECPDPVLQEIYYYRWWTFRKHIRQTPVGAIVTEFIQPVRHAGAFNSISCAVGHHLAEGRWLRGQDFLDEYSLFWFRGAAGAPQPRFHKYSQWTAAAMLDRARVTGDPRLLVELFEDLIRDYARWEQEKLLPDGMFWQHDVWDGMEESISGSRTHRNRRPTINSFMFANAQAIVEIAALAGELNVAEMFRNKARELKALVQHNLWDPQAKFFKAQTEEGPLSDAREAIGFVPWCFNLPDPGHEEAWRELIDPQGFWAPCGMTTAERRHPRFRSHGVGKCEWDGAVWPFATSQTLSAMANLLRHYEQPYVTRDHYLQAMQVYAKSQHRDGKPYIGEYLDETTGEWLKGDNPRSRYYNHSTFCDLVISGLVGVCPRADQNVEISPLLPPDAWDYFCLENAPVHGRALTIAWDRTGEHYNAGAGLRVWLDDVLIASSAELRTLTIRTAQRVGTA